MEEIPTTGHEEPHEEPLFSHAWRSHPLVVEPLIDLHPGAEAPFPEGLGREWIETNGIGGYASSTIFGANTRRHHGLLAASLGPPLGRVLLVSKLDETFTRQAESVPLATNLFKGKVEPRGHMHLARFRLAPFPIFTFAIGETLLEKSVYLVHGENTVVVRYDMTENEAEGGALAVRLLITFRDIHGLSRANDYLNPAIENRPGRVRFRPYPLLPTLTLFHNAESVSPVSEWVRDLEYHHEKELQRDAEEDLYCPCELLFRLEPNRPAYLVATSERRSDFPPGLFLDTELRRRETHRLPDSEDQAPAERKLLTAAADAYPITRPKHGRSVIAGYPDYGDRGRDALVSLPGLLLATGRFDEAREMLTGYGKNLLQGLVPNYQPDDSEEIFYDAADTSLWFIHAVFAYLRASGDLESVRKDLYPATMEIIHQYKESTLHGIFMDEDGLVTQSDETCALTWMNASFGGEFVTPRRGRTVEVSALWYSALKIAEQLAKECGHEADRRVQGLLAIVTGESFNRLFWNTRKGYLNDFLDGEVPDTALRPNQIFAVSLPFSPLIRERQLKVLEAVREHLLTPFGLRTLAPSDPRYRGACTGSEGERALAAHNGSVWPWLLGPYVDALIRVNGRKEETLKEARRLIEPICGRLGETGLGHIPEMFDGDPPHHPRGCIAQAWSVAEILRLRLTL